MASRKCKLIASTPGGVTTISRQPATQEGYIALLRDVFAALKKDRESKGRGPLHYSDVDILLDCGGPSAVKRGAQWNVPWSRNAVFLMSCGSTRHQWTKGKGVPVCSTIYSQRRAISEEKALLQGLIPRRRNR